MHIAALVLGIVGLVISLIPIVGMYALPLTALALLFGALTIRKPKKGMAIAGLTLGIIGSGLAGFQIYAWQKTKAAVEAAIRDGGPLSEEAIKASFDQALKDGIKVEVQPAPAAATAPTAAKPVQQP